MVKAYIADISRVSSARVNSFACKWFVRRRTSLVLDRTLISLHLCCFQMDEMPRFMAWREAAATGAFIVGDGRMNSQTSLFWVFALCVRFVDTRTYVT